jgi:hypothetical protein
LTPYPAMHTSPHTILHTVHHTTHYPLHATHYTLHTTHHIHRIFHYTPHPSYTKTFKLWSARKRKEREIVETVCEGLMKKPSKFRKVGPMCVCVCVFVLPSNCVMSSLWYCSSMLPTYTHTHTHTHTYPHTNTHTNTHTHTHTHTQELGSETDEDMGLDYAKYLAQSRQGDAQGSNNRRRRL